MGVHFSIDLSPAQLLVLLDFKRWEDDGKPDPYGDGVVSPFAAGRSRDFVATTGSLIRHGFVWHRRTQGDGGRGPASEKWGLTPRGRKTVELFEDEIRELLALYEAREPPRPKRRRGA